MSKQTGNSQAMESKKEENAIEPFKYKILGMNTEVPKEWKQATKYTTVTTLIRDVLTNEQPHLAFFQKFKNKKRYFQEKVLLEKENEFFVDEAAMIMIDLKEFEVINLEQLKIQGFINSTDSLLDKMVIVKVYTNRNPKETFVCVALQRKEKENAEEKFQELLEFLNTVGNHTEKQLPMLIVGGFNIAIGEIENLVEPPFKIEPFESIVRSGYKEMKDFFITRNLDLEKVRAVDIESIARNRNASSSKESQPYKMFSHDPISCVLSKANIKTNENAQAESATNQTEIPPWAKELLKRMENLETEFSQLQQAFENSGCNTHIPATEEGS